MRPGCANLCGNAVKFTPRGEIAVEVHNVNADANHLTIRFVVRDTGIGISADRIDSLFEPFVQGDASTTRRFGGTGLGLSIVKRLAHLMGGETGVTSQEGDGSSFWFTARFCRSTQGLGSRSGLREFRPGGARGNAQCLQSPAAVRCGPPGPSNAGC
jgi:two-component system sensor histidine kinase/response regulator